MPSQADELEEFAMKRKTIKISGAHARSKSQRSISIASTWDREGRLHSGQKYTVLVWHLWLGA